MVRLADQDRERWDRELIAEGHASSVRVCAGTIRVVPIQAAIAAVHADAANAEGHGLGPSWPSTTTLRPPPNPVVAINRVAVGELRGARPDSLLSTTSLPTRRPLPTVPRGTRRPPRPRRPARSPRLPASGEVDHEPGRTSLPAFSAQQGRSALVELNIRNDVGHVSLDHEVHTLDEAACRSLIASGGLGRVAVTDRALPMILPVAFACLGADIAVRLALGRPRPRGRRRPGRVLPDRQYRPFGPRDRGRMERRGDRPAPAGRRSRAKSSRAAGSASGADPPARSPCSRRSCSAAARAHPESPHPESRSDAALTTGWACRRTAWVSGGGGRRTPRPRCADCIPILASRLLT